VCFFARHTDNKEPQNQCVYSYADAASTPWANVLTFSISPLLEVIVDGDKRYLTFTERMLCVSPRLWPSQRLIISTVWNKFSCLNITTVFKFKDFNANSISSIYIPNCLSIKDFLHTTSENFENPTITGHFGFLFEGNTVTKITRLY